MDFIDDLKRPYQQTEHEITSATDPLDYETLFVIRDY